MSDDEVIEYFRNLVYGEYELFNIRITLTLAAGSSMRDAWEQNLMRATGLFLSLSVHSGAGPLCLEKRAGQAALLNYLSLFAKHTGFNSSYFYRLIMWLHFACAILFNAHYNRIK